MNLERERGLIRRECFAKECTCSTTARRSAASPCAISRRRRNSTHRRSESTSPTCPGWRISRAAGPISLYRAALSIRRSYPDASRRRTPRGHRSRAAGRHLLAVGHGLRGRTLMRISVCAWSATDGDVRRSAAAILRAHAAVKSGNGRRSRGPVPTLRTPCRRRRRAAPCRWERKREPREDRDDRGGDRDRRC